jgi:uncharacterized protein (TIGR03118 family)
MKTILLSERLRIVGNLKAKKAFRPSFNLFAALALFMIVATGCDKFFNEIPGNGGVGNNNYVQTNLVSDTTSYHAARIDSTLSNAWGIAINPNGIFWINANGTDGSEVYDMNGLPKRTPVAVPSPSGIVFNHTTDFTISATGQVSKFIFASENGKIYAWSSGDSARTVADQSASNAVYKGIELAKDGNDNFLYATDFHNGKIDVFDKSFKLVASKPFSDTTIPSGFAPFNIRLIDNVLFVTYAKQLGSEKKDDEKGIGNGYVNTFKTDGTLLKRFASQGQLNSPWGIEKAPAGFGQGKNVILIGNFGDGHINVFNALGGEFIRPLKMNGMPLTIEGLWAITFPDNNVPGDNPNKLYFTAGPDDESHGLFGYLKK